MLHLCTAQVKVRQDSAVRYVPIAQSLLMLEKSEQERTQCKFDICYTMAKEDVAIKKYAALYELEVCHGFDLGFAYKIALSAQLFTHYIA